MIGGQDYTKKQVVVAWLEIIDRGLSGDYPKTKYCSCNNGAKKSELHKANPYGETALRRDQLRYCRPLA